MVQHSNSPALAGADDLVACWSCTKLLPISQIVDLGGCLMPSCPQCWQAMPIADRFRVAREISSQRMSAEVLENLAELLGIANEHVASELGQSVLPSWLKGGGKN